jgi:transposase, IS5 family
LGQQLLKYPRNVSDEDVVTASSENPYWQYFCGEQYFRHDLPIDPSLMTLFRNRIDAEGCEFILGLTVQTGWATKTIAAASLAVVNVDTTVQDKAVAFPTDARLLNKARIAVVKLATQCGIQLRQPYTFKGQKAFHQSARYAHARQFNRAAKQTKQLRTMLGRVIRDTQRKAERMALPAKARTRLDKLLAVANRIHSHCAIGAPCATTNRWFIWTKPALPPARTATMAGQPKASRCVACKTANQDRAPV